MAKKTGKGSGKAYYVDPEDVNLGSPVATKGRMGRPPKYKPKLAQKVCQLIAEGNSLRKVCQLEGMPSRSTVFEWIVQYDEFSDQYARAKEKSVESMAEEILEIADDGTNDYVADNYDKGRTPGYRVDGENIQRSKLRVDTRKWLMGKLKPKKYGDKLDVTSGGDKVEVAPIYGGLSGNSGPADTRD